MSKVGRWHEAYACPLWPRRDDAPGLGWAKAPESHGIRKGVAIRQGSNRTYLIRGSFAKRSFAIFLIRGSFAFGGFRIRGPFAKWSFAIFLIRGSFAFAAIAAAENQTASD